MFYEIDCETPDRDWSKKYFFEAIPSTGDIITLISSNGFPQRYRVAGRDFIGLPNLVQEFGHSPNISLLLVRPER